MWRGTHGLPGIARSPRRARRLPVCWWLGGRPHRRKPGRHSRWRHRAHRRHRFPGMVSSTRDAGGWVGPDDSGVRGIPLRPGGRDLAVRRASGEMVCRDAPGVSPRGTTTFSASGSRRHRGAGSSMGWTFWGAVARKLAAGAGTVPPGMTEQWVGKPTSRTKPRSRATEFLRPWLRRRALWSCCRRHGRQGRGRDSKPGAMATAAADHCRGHAVAHPRARSTKAVEDLAGGLEAVGTQRRVATASAVAQQPTIRASAGDTGPAFANRVPIPRTHQAPSAREPGGGGPVRA